MKSAIDSEKRKGKCGAEASAPAGPVRIDLGEAARSGCAEKKGPELWRSLDELAGTPEFQEMLHREFPRHASEWPEGVSRRRFLQLSERLARARRPDRLHPPADREDRPLRPPARADHPRPAAVLRHRPDARRLRHGRARREPHRAGRPRSRATRTTRRAWAPPTCSPRRPSSRSTTRTARRRSCTTAGRAPGAASWAR